MPEYLAPGVFVEEVSFRNKSIEGVSTTTTGFIGPTRFGPVEVEPEVITSLTEYERTFGDRQQFLFKKFDPVANTALDEPAMHNYMWHAVRAFFEEGGKRLYIARTFNPISDTNDGYAAAWLPGAPSASSGPAVRLSSRFPGEAGKMRVRFTLQRGSNILGGDPTPGKATANGLLDGDVVWLSDIVNSPPASPLPEDYVKPGSFYIANIVEDTAGKTWRFSRPQVTGVSYSSPITDGDPTTVDLAHLTADPNPQISDEVRVVTITVTTISLDSDLLPPNVWPGLALQPDHERAGEPDSIFTKFASTEELPNPSLARNLPLVLKRKDSTGGVKLENGLQLLDLLFQMNPLLASALENPKSTDQERSVDFILAGGNDGQRPEPDQYEGSGNEPEAKVKMGLVGFEDIDDISIVAAPGSTFGYENGYRAQAATIMNLLISHAERMHYRIAVLDSGEGQSIGNVRDLRGRIDSSYAAIYYPWVRVLDPVTRQEIHLPPSGFVAGIYARNDIQRAVWKAPANEVVNLALGFEKLLNKAEQEVLNPLGINCFRFFEGRGFRLWGARTISSDPEWKYVNLRRYFAYLEHSIDKGTQWAVFEPNGEALWANVRQTVSEFLFNEWSSGALLGDKPEKAYFVKCDRSTMTQNDLDNGRLICLIGVAALKPAEFVIFRIGQWTADSKR